MSSEEKLKKEWAQKVEGSNGTMVNVPESFKDETVEFQKKSKEYQQKARDFDRFTAEFDVYAKGFWLEMRKAVEATGNETVWNHNIGFNQQAQADGITIVNLTKPTPQGMEM